MTANEFRTLALSFAEAVDGEHAGHPDFRVRGKIFATLGPDEDWGMVKLTPDQQETYLRAAPTIFTPASGAWGQHGATIIRLQGARKPTVRRALKAAWQNAGAKEGKSAGRR